MADEENKVPENDDWLNDLDSEPEFASVDDGLDSSAFDKMFGELHSSDTPAPEPVKAAGEVIPEEEAAPESLPESLPAEPAPAEESVAAVATEKGAGQEELGVELDQSNIDSLLNEVEESADAPTEEEAAPLDQSSIDALMGGGDAAAASAEPEEAVAEKPTKRPLPRLRRYLNRLRHLPNQFRRQTPLPPILLMTVVNSLPRQICRPLKICPIRTTPLSLKVMNSMTSLAIPPVRR